MKVLGLSFGRKDQNCDICVKQALLGAQAAGAEVMFLNTMHLKITHCTGCGACDKRREKGGPSRCVIKDDFAFVENAILEADGIILAAPVYVLGPTGQFKNLVDRMGPSHDRAQMEDVQAQRIAAGKSGEELLDPRLFKDRFLGYISVGGARTENWTSMGLPNMHLFGFSMQMTPVDQINVYDMGDRVKPFFDPALTADLTAMGEHVAKAIGQNRYEVPWMGKSQGHCPLCHNDLVTLKGGTTVECPICGMAGTLEIVDGEIRVQYSPEQINQARLRPQGVLDHHLEINSFGPHVMEVIVQRGAEIPGFMAQYDGIPVLDPKDFVENMKQ